MALGERRSVKVGELSALRLHGLFVGGQSAFPDNVAAIYAELLIEVFENGFVKGDFLAFACGFLQNNGVYEADEKKCGGQNKCDALFHGDTSLC